MHLLPAADLLRCRQCAGGSETLLLRRAGSGYVREAIEQGFTGSLSYPELGFEALAEVVTAAAEAAA